MQSTINDLKTDTTHKERSLMEYAGVTLRGICMGASDIVPGVSGGTMAFILGIYEELIDSIRVVGRPEFITAVLKFRIKEIFQILNWKFLLSLAIGVFIAILTLSKGLEWLLVNQPVLLWSFFFGLVLASVLSVSKRVSSWTPPLYLLTIGGAVGAYLLVGAVPLQTPNAWWFLILSGALAICAMILPGVSGAFILVLLGKYQYVLSAVNQRDIITIAFIGIGAVIGLVTFAQILGWLFKSYNNGTVAVLTGLMVGSLRKVWPWKLDVAWLQDAAGEFVLSHGERIVTQQQNMLPDFSSTAGITQAGTAIVLALIGFGAILLLDRLAGEQKDRD